jgi:hypothetical protein
MFQFVKKLLCSHQQVVSESAKLTCLHCKAVVA